MGVSNLIEIFDEKYYRNLSGGILEAFGKLFFKNMLVYLYPMIDEKTGEIVSSTNLRVSAQVKNSINSLPTITKWLISRTTIKTISIYTPEKYFHSSTKENKAGKQCCQKSHRTHQRKQLFGYQRIAFKTIANLLVSEQRVLLF